MKTPNWKPELLTTIKGIDYTLHFKPEYNISAKEHFMGDCDWSLDQYEAIKNCYWFSATLQATKNGIELANEYLGGNCYKNKIDVMRNNLADTLSGYAIDMINECRPQAEKELKQQVMKTKQILLDLQA